MRVGNVGRSTFALFAAALAALLILRVLWMVSTTTGKLVTKGRSHGSSWLDSLQFVADGPADSAAEGSGEGGVLGDSSQQLEPTPAMVQSTAKVVRQTSAARVTKKRIVVTTVTEAGDLPQATVREVAESIEGGRRVDGEATAQGTGSPVSSVTATNHPATRRGKAATPAADGKAVNNKAGKGKGKVDWSHYGLVPDADGINHGPTHCYGMKKLDGCLPPDSKYVEWFRNHVVLGIVTGKQDTFRVDVSACTWLGHVPPENLFVFTDVVPRRYNQTAAAAAEDPSTEKEKRNGPANGPVNWVRIGLPTGVWWRGADLYSEKLANGYVSVVRKAGQGYSASWIAAQFRFLLGLQMMVKHGVRGPDSGVFDDELAGEVEPNEAAKSSLAALRKRDIRWVMLVDDDTIVNVRNLYHRLRGEDWKSKPLYLSRRGWGGAGHLFGLPAVHIMQRQLNTCITKYMVERFRASDDMLVKCSGMLKLTTPLEKSMTHCPASHLGAANLQSTRLITLHGKKDFYPPLLLTSWRSSLYYLASYCGSSKAADMAVEWSACAYGSCKQQGCTKARDTERAARWAKLSRNDTLHYLPHEQQGLSLSDVERDATKGMADRG